MSTPRLPQFRKPKYAAVLTAGASLTILLLLIVFLRPAGPTPATEKPALPANVSAGSLPSNALRLPPAPSASETTDPTAPLIWQNDEAGNASLWSALSAARHEVEAISEEHASLAQNHGVHLFAQNPGNQFTMRFLDESVRIASGRSDSRWQADVSVPGLPPAREIVYEGGRVEYDRGSIIEWYENRPGGLQQGFIVREPQSADGTIRVEIAMEGLLPRAAGDDVIHLLDTNGGEILSYSELLAWDATGRELPAKMEALADGVALVVSTMGATYPVTIDPVFATLQEKIGPTVVGDGVPTAYLGWSVDISGNTVVVGAPGDDTPLGTDSGSAYVFQIEKGTWLRQAKLLSNDGEMDDYFGYSVAISANTIAVGSPGDDTSQGSDSGSAYVFVRDPKLTTWNQSAKILPADTTTGDELGNAVTIEGNTVLIGSRLADTAGGVNAGCAYVFTRGKDPASLWSQEARLVADDGAMNDFFGSALSLSKNTAVIGTPADDTMAGTDAGSAYVFARSGTTWTQQAKLAMENAAANNYFGAATAIDKETVVVGVTGYDDIATNQGCAIVFQRSRGTWSQVAQLARTSADEDDFMGNSVAVFGKNLAVGAPGAASGSAYPNKGAVYPYLLNRGVWEAQSALQPGSASSNARCGYSLALEKNQLVTGAPYDNTEAGTEAGRAYVYRFNANNGWIDSAISAGQTQAGAEMGTSIAIYKDTLVAGAPLDDTSGGTDAGRAYVFTRVKNAWFLKATLSESPGSSNDYFGQSVAISKDHILVGIPGWDSAFKTDIGAALAYTRTKTGWDTPDNLIRSDAEDNDAFGTSVAISGGTALVGSPYDDTDAGTDAGSAYLFSHVKKSDSWSSPTKLTASDAAASDYFGSSVSLTNKQALIGAPGDDNANLTNSGSAYLFQPGGDDWVQQTKLVADDGEAEDRFGSAVSVNGNIALVGAPFDDTAGGTNAGSAYLFTRKGKTWLSTRKLTAEDGAAEDFFGSAVAVDKKNALIGAPLDDTGAGTNAGSAYNFGPASGSSDWLQLQKLADPGSAPFDRFGFSVGLSGNTAVISAPYDDTLYGTNTGTVLIFIP